MPGITRMVYVDDSGDSIRGHMVYGWVEVEPEHWRATLRDWLTFRSWLLAEYGIPVHEELHTTQYAMGRARISKSVPGRFIHDGETYWKDIGREVAELVLERINSLEHVSVGAVARKTQARGREFTAENGALYRDLVWFFDQSMKRGSDLMLISMDGDGSNKSYYAAHRNLELATRHVIEDPMFHDSKRSQWTQMADAVAYAAFVHKYPHEQNEFAWTWWTKWLDPKSLTSDPFSPPTAPVRG